MDADLDDSVRAEQLVPRVLEVAKRLDILVNGVSIFPASPSGDSRPGQPHASLRVNAWAPLVLSRRMAALSSEGRIVNLLDSTLMGYDREHPGYSIGKHALSHLTDMLAIELAPRFTVNAVAPGPILPPAGRGEGYLLTKARELPLKRAGSPQERGPCRGLSPGKSLHHRTDNLRRRRRTSS